MRIVGAKEIIIGVIAGAAVVVVVQLIRSRDGRGPR